jgi:hypothetical protein
MSLVNEALRKARAIAARQEALKRGIPYPTLDPELRRSDFRRIWWAGGIALGIIAVGVIFYLVGLRAGATKVESETASLNFPASQEPGETVAASTRPSSAEPGAAGAAEDAVAPLSRPDTAPVRSADPEPPPVDLNLPRSSADAGGTATGRKTGSPPATVPATPTERSPTEGTTEPRVEAPEIALPTPAPTTELPPATGPQSPRSFLREADVPGIGRLQLAGIAWSEDRPFALINGKVVGRGDSVDGLRVVEIQPKEVLLDGDGEQILLRLR